MSGTTDPHAPITDALIATVERFLAVAQPGQRLQLYPSPEFTSPEWWGAITDATDGPSDWGWPTAAAGLAYVAALPLRELTSPPATLTPAEHTLLRELFPAFRAWSRFVAEGCTDNGPALVLASDLSGFVFYDGEEFAPWAQLADVAGLIERLPGPKPGDTRHVDEIAFTFDDTQGFLLWAHTDQRHWRWEVAWAKPINGQPGYFCASVEDRSPKGKQAKHPTDNTVLLTGSEVGVDGRMTLQAPLYDVPSTWEALLSAIAELIKRGEWPKWRKSAVV